MVKNVNSTAVARPATLEKQVGIKSRDDYNPFDINVSDKVEISSEAKSTSQVPQSESQVQSEPIKGSNLFADVFLANVNTHGIKGAYDLAWEAVRSNSSDDSNFPAYSSEKQSGISIDINAYY